MKMKLRYVQAWVDRKTGIAYHRFRRAGYPNISLPGLPGSREFMAAYQDALEQPHVEIGASKRSIAGSVSATIARYYDSTRYFGSLAPGTQVARRGILEHFREKHGDKPIAQLPPKFIALTLDQMTPHRARNWLTAIRHLMQFAISAELCTTDPTQGIKIKLPKSDGVYTWNENDVAAYEATHAIATKPRLAMALALYTAQRRSDIIRMGPQHIRNGVLHIRQDKTGATLDIPVHPDLQKIIDATPCGHLTFLTTYTGKPYGGNDFSEMFRTWCDAAGLPAACSVHGLRKAACRRLAEAGCSASEIAAISGHATLSEVGRYTKAADQARLARNAMAKQAVNDQATPTVKIADDLTIRPKKPA
jgi:integrase